MNELKNIINEIRMNNGCNINTSLQLQNFNNGYMVSINNHEKTIDLQNISDLNDLIIQKNIFDCILEKIDIIKQLQKNNHKSLYVIGLWYNTNDKKLYIDISINIKSLNMAKMQGIKNNQFCIYDIKNQCDIELKKDVYIVYKYDKIHNDFIYLKEYTRATDVQKALKMHYNSFYNCLVNTIDNFNLSKLYLNKYAIVKDSAFYRDLNY